MVGKDKDEKDSMANASKQEAVQDREEKFGLSLQGEKPLRIEPKKGSQQSVEPGKAAGLKEETKTLRKVESFEKTPMPGISPAPRNSPLLNFLVVLSFILLLLTAGVLYFPAMDKPLPSFIQQLVSLVGAP